MFATTAPSAAPNPTMALPAPSFTQAGATQNVRQLPTALTANGEGHFLKYQLPQPASGDRPIARKGDSGGGRNVASLPVSTAAPEPSTLMPSGFALPALRSNPLTLGLPLTSQFMAQLAAQDTASLAAFAPVMLPKREIATTQPEADDVQLHRLMRLARGDMTLEEFTATSPRQLTPLPAKQASPLHVGQQLALTQQASARADILALRQSQLAYRTTQARLSPSSAR